MNTIIIARNPIKNIFQSYKAGSRDRQAFRKGKLAYLFKEEIPNQQANGSNNIPGKPDTTPKPGPTPPSLPPEVPPPIDEPIGEPQPPQPQLPDIKD